VKQLPQQVASRLKNAPPEVKLKAAELLAQINKKQEIEACQKDFLKFVERMWPSFIAGRHHAMVARQFERIITGECKRLIINMPPRHTKSEFGSYLLPAWFLGRHPTKKVIQSAHTAELAVGFGRKVRDLVDTKEYAEVFPGTSLKTDSKAAGAWQTSQKGSYFAIGVGGAVTGRGADLLIIDDPHSEQEAMAGDPAVFDRVYEWYTSGPRQRLQPGGAIIVIMTRWHLRDLTGQIIKSAAQRGATDEWEVIEFPAIMPSGEPLWPEFWSKKELESLKDELPGPKWNAQYQQSPTSEEGALIKREWWKRWEDHSPPHCEFVIQSWDTAFTKNERSDYSACVTIGVFYKPDDEGRSRPNIILLDAFKGRWEFPELKKEAMSAYTAIQPDSVIIEAKAAGLPLIHELRRMGIPITEYTPSRGNDKIARVNSVSDLFASGVIWAPSTRFAEEVIEECASFPSGEHDDLVDSMTQALIRFRQGGFIRLPSDEEDEYVERTRVEYY